MNTTPGLVEKLDLEIAQRESQLRALRAARAVLQGSPASPPEKPRRGRPRLTPTNGVAPPPGTSLTIASRIAHVLADGKVWSPKNITEALRKNGLPKISRGTVGAALLRHLSGRGSSLFESDGKGGYRLLNGEITTQQ